MIKNFKNTFVILFLGFTCGYIIRMITVSKPSEIVSTTQVNNVTTQKTEVLTQAEVKKDSTTVKQTIVVRKTFNSKGKVTSETHVQEQVGTSTLENWALASELSKNSIEQVSESTKTITTYKPNWEIGGMIPASSLKSPQNYKDFTIDIGYRLFFDVYARAEVKPVNFNTSIGFFILL